MQNFRGQTRCIMGDVQMVNVPRVPIFRSLKGSCIHSFVIHHLCVGEKIPRQRSLYSEGRPHYSQSSCENATPSSSTCPLASYKEVTPPSGLYKHHHDISNDILPYLCVKKLITLLFRFIRL